MAKLAVNTVIITELSNKLYNVNPHENIDELPNGKKYRIKGTKKVRGNDLYILTYARKGSDRNFWVHVNDIDSKLTEKPQCSMDIVFSNLSGGAIYIV